MTLVLINKIDSWKWSVSKITGPKTNENIIGQHLTQMIIQNYGGIKTQEDAVPALLMWSATQERKVRDREMEREWEIVGGGVRELKRYWEQERVHPMVLHLQFMYTEPKALHMKQLLTSSWDDLLHEQKGWMHMNPALNRVSTRGSNWFLQPKRQNRREEDTEPLGTGIWYRASK